MSSSVSSRSPAEAIEVDAEIKRLARLLGVSHTELAYLATLPSVELRLLRDQVTESLFDHQVALVRIAATTRILPVGLTASMAEKVFGPMLAARIAGLVDPERAVEIAARLPTPFLADVALELDPRRVASILARIPSGTVADVTRLLAQREEWVAMGTFLAYLPPEPIRAAIAEMDGHALLHVALVLDDKSTLPGVLDVADPARLVEIARAAEAEGRSEQLEALTVYFTDEQRARLRG